MPPPPPHYPQRSIAENPSGENLRQNLKESRNERATGILRCTQRLRQRVFAVSAAYIGRATGHSIEEYAGDRILTRARRVETIAARDLLTLKLVQPGGVTESE